MNNDQSDDQNDNDAAQAQAPAASPQAPGPEPTRASSIFRMPLTRVQAFVGVAAGLLTISGTILPLAGVSFQGRPHGEIVTLVQDARSRKPVPEATVEIFTAQNVLVTTLSSAADGRAIRRLKEGRYRLRITHPRFFPETRHVEVSYGERSDVRIALGVRAAPVAAAPVEPPVVSVQSIQTVSKNAVLPPPREALRTGEPARIIEQSR